MFHACDTKYDVTENLENAKPRSHNALHPLTDVVSAGAPGHFPWTDSRTLCLPLADVGLHVPPRARKWISGSPLRPALQETRLGKR